MVARSTVRLRVPAQGPLVRTVVDATADMPARDLQGPKVLGILLERLADKLLPTTDPLAMAKLRGHLAMREVLNADGGALPASELAELLGISRQAVDKRRKAGQLLAVSLPRRGLLYPAWQLTEKGTALAGVAEVLAVLPANDGWARARFFVTGSDRLGGKRPLDLLRKGVLGAVVAAARAFGEHGAA